MKTFEQFVNDIKIDNQFGENELLKKFSKEDINELLNIILSDKDLIKYKSKNYKVKTGGISIVIIFDKYVVKITASESEKRKIQTLQKYGKNLKYIYNFPYTLKQMNFKNTNLLCVVLDKFDMVEKEIQEFIDKIGYEMISFDEFKFLYYYKHKDGIIGRKKMRLREGLSDEELNNEYQKRLQNIKTKLNQKELSYLNDIENMYKEYNTIKNKLTSEDRLDVSSTNVGLFNGHLIIYDL